MTNFIDGKPLCNIPKKLSESGAFSIWGQDCRGTTFYELRNSRGDVIQNFNDSKKAERALTEQAVRASQRKSEMQNNPDLERVDQAFQKLAGHEDRVRAEQRQRFAGLPLEQIPTDLLTDEEKRQHNI